MSLRILVRVVGALCLLFLLYAAFDLLRPVRADLRTFDPKAIGDMETHMWQSYYSRKPVKLFFELAQVLRTQYGFPFLRSYVGAYHAAHAAFVFKDGRNREDYEKALQPLRAYFAEIHRTGNVDFDVQTAARRELDWWILRREREKYQVDLLGKACAEAAAAIYLIAPDSAMEHGNLRAEAMEIRDSTAVHGGVTEADWTKIDSLLCQCYISLRSAVNAPATK